MSIAGWNHINLEVKPHAKNKVTTNLIWANFTNWGERIKHFDPAQDWHEYEIQWTPEHITFIIDGVERRREVHTEDDFNEALNDLNKKQHLIMAFWTPNWAAEHLEDTSSMPWYTKYDYVKAYDYMGKNETTGEDIFTLRFEENFDGDRINTDRWQLSHHTFDDTSTTFVPENAYVEDGKLVFKMERIRGSEPEPKPKPDDGDEGYDFHVLPAPEADSIDAAIEKTVRVGVTMVRGMLDDFSSSMSHHLQ